MDSRESFEAAWRARFPVDKPPELQCLQTGAGEAHVNLDLAREEKRKFENKILALKNQLQQHEFVISFLWDVIHGPSSPSGLALKRGANLEAPAEAPPPLPVFPGDLSLDCPVPLGTEEPSGPGPQPSQVPAYMETDLDFVVAPQISPVSVEPRSSKSKTGNGKKQGSSKKKGSKKVSDDKNVSDDKCHSQNREPTPHIKCIGKQQSLDSVRCTPGVSTEPSKAHTPVDCTLDTLEESSSDQASHSATGQAYAGNKIKLIRKFSADSNVSVAQSQLDLFDSQRRSYNFGVLVDGETRKGTHQSSPKATTFTTFKPVETSGTGSKWSTEADRKSKPTPAPRPSIVGPEYKLKGGPMDGTGVFVDDLSPVQEQEFQLPAADGAPQKDKPLDEQTNHSCDASKNSGESSSTVSKPSLEYSASVRGNESGKPKKERPATMQKPSRKDTLSFSKPDVKVTTGPPTMKVRPLNSNSSQEPPVSDLKVVSIPRSLSPVSIPAAQSSVPKSSFKEKKVLGPAATLPTTHTPEKIYEEPIPVRSDKIEEASSSDEDEPVYQNLMLLKQRSMARGQTASRSRFFESVDFQKKHLHKQAERLSRRFSSLDGGLPGSLPRFHTSDVMATIGEKPPPGMSIPGGGNHSDSSPSLWRKRSSMMYATGDDTASEDDLDVAVPPCAEDDKIQMRKFVLTSIVSSEKAYLLTLDTLMQYMQTFKNVQGTPQSVISAEDIQTIFNKIPELHRVHFDFIKNLEPVLERWTGEQEIASYFQELALAECGLATEYLRNYQEAVNAIQRCTAESEQFSNLTKDINCKGSEKAETSSLEELLHKPVVRFQRNTLVLHDLIQFTPTSHKDYDTLQKTRKIAQNFLENFTSPVSKNNAENQRYLSKQGLVVEKVGSGNQRKLRHIFLFNDVFICAKEKLSRQRSTFDVKWFVPLQEAVMVDDRQTAQEERQLAESTKQETDRLQKKVSELQTELKAELKKAKQASDGSRTWSFRTHKSSLEKIRKKLFEQEAMLMLTAPHLIFKLKSKKTDKSHLLLLASDYERNSWKETISGLQQKPIIPGAMSTVELTNVVNSLKLPKLSSTGSIDDFELEDEALFGSLDVTIHRMFGLKTTCDVFCCMEVDSFGHFCMKAKTNIISKTTEPVWNENFDIELDGAQQLRVLCYKLDGDKESILGRCALELGKGWLRGDFSEEAISIGESMTLVVTLKYRSREQTIKRTPSSIQGGLFGVKISSITKREGKKIPLIITYCVEEVERRGMEDVGIYRISGLSAEISRLKKAFERSPAGAGQVIREMDVNVITGLLKLYLRELPESLFTDRLYNQLQEGLTLSDPEGKEKFMMSLLRSLPEPNLSTVFYLLDHLVRVSKHEANNKMSLHNLATVFGPTLLRPAMKEAEPVSMEQLFTAGARDAMMQTGILYFYLTNWENKDSQNTRLY